MWVRKRIDIDWSDILYGLARSCWPANREEVLRQLEADWSDGEDDALVCLSVRTGFDLLLRTVEWAEGSEVLMSAATIHDMVKIVEHHGLTPVPVDLDVPRMAPKLEAIRRAITPRTRAIVVAHLFGGRVELDAIVKLAREHNLLVIEDCAQAYVGDRFKGHADADVSMFSFGPIKTCTSLGGAILRVRQPELLDAMRELHDGYISQRHFYYFRRLLKYAAIKALSSRPYAGAIAMAFRLIGSDHDAFANHLARGFAGPGFFERIRRRPSRTLMTVMRRKFSRLREDLLQLRTERGQMLLDKFAKRVPVPGDESLDHSFWVFPIVVDEPRLLLKKLWRAGFDATQGESMCIVQPPQDRPDLAAIDAEEMSAKMVFLPFYPQMSEKSLLRMADIVLEECGSPQPRRRRWRDDGPADTTPAEPVKEDRRRLGEIVRAKLHSRREARHNGTRKPRRRRVREWVSQKVSRH